jgi:uncharacterized protein (TIGR02611 family)
MELVKQRWQNAPGSIRKPLVLIGGTLVLIPGIIMLVTPGPGWAVIFLALAIYATEFKRAKNIRDWLIKKFKSAWEYATKKKK